MFSSVVRRSLVRRSDGVIAHPVRVGAITGIEASVRPVILAQSSCLRAKASGLWSKASGLTAIRSRRSSRFGGVVEIKVEAKVTPPGIEVGFLPDEGATGALAGWKSAPELFKALAMPAKLVGFAAEVVVSFEGWLWTRIGAKLVPLVSA